jgi:hypothetical protein
MATHINGGFASPLADAQYPAPLNSGAGGFLSRAYNGLSAFNILALFFLTVVLYDQCELGSLDLPTPNVLACPLNMVSQVCVEQGKHCGTLIEDPIHGALSRVDLSEDGCLQGQMGQWRSELRLCFP